MSTPILPVAMAVVTAVGTVGGITLKEKADDAKAAAALALAESRRELDEVKQDVRGLLERERQRLIAENERLKAAGASIPKGT